MKIVIANGGHAADYIIKQFRSRKNNIIIINSSKQTANYLAKTNKLPVIYGEPWKINVLDAAHVQDCDIFVALGYIDTDNYVSCMLAKKLFNAKKCICIVNNPKNVDLFRDLGIDSVISSTYLLASSIFSETSLEKLTKSMSFQDDKIVMVEVTVRESNIISNKQIMDINFPKTGTISCVYRKPNVLIPNGKTVILPGDKLFIVTSKKDQPGIVEFVQREAVGENEE